MKKTGLFAAAAVMALCLGGCGKTTNNLGNAVDRYNDSIYGTGTYSSGGVGYWDGYGINGGRTVVPTDTGRNTYGMRTDTANVRNGVNRTTDTLTNNPVTRTVRDAVDGKTSNMVG